MCREIFLREPPTEPQASTRCSVCPACSALLQWSRILSYSRYHSTVTEIDKQNNWRHSPKVIQRSVSAISLVFNFEKPLGIQSSDPTCHTFVRSADVDLPTRTSVNGSLGNTRQYLFGTTIYFKTHNSAPSRNAPQRIPLQCLRLYFW